MAHDIESPLQLVDDFDIIYTMNWVDFRYGGPNITSKTIMSLIKLVLETGKNFYSMPEKIAHLGLYERPTAIENVQILTPSKLISKSFYDCDGNEITYDDIIPPERKYDEAGNLIEYDKDGNYIGGCDTQRIKWVLNFEYKDKPRKLVYYFGYNFECNWPEDICDISHIMMQGSFMFTNLRDMNDHTNWNKACVTNTNYIYDPEKHAPHKELIELIESRTVMPLTFYDGRSYFDNKKVVWRSKGFASNRKQEISYITFDSLKPYWWRDTLPYVIPTDKF